MAILVTGARGNVGRHVVAALAATGHEVVASGRDAKTLDVPAGVRTIELDLEKPHTLEGIHAVFLYTRPAGIDGFVKAAKEAGVRHVVQLSSAATLQKGGEETRLVVLHRTVERALEESGLGYTLLHPGAFAANALGWAPGIRAGVVEVPYPDARIGAIHEADIAAVAAHLLGTATHLGRSLELSGPEAISPREQIAVLSDVLGREIAVREIDAETAVAGMTGPFMPEETARAILRSWASALDEPAPVTTTVEDVTGIPPRTFRRWAEDHRADF